MYESLSSTHWLRAEAIKCVGCGSGTWATFIEGTGRDWMMTPTGWFVADTYPPGDNGLQYACSIECARKREQDEMSEREKG
jgi:hypothetical protein